MTVQESCAIWKPGGVKWFHYWGEKLDLRHDKNSAVAPVSRVQQFTRILLLAKTLKVFQPAGMLSGSHWLIIEEMESLKPRFMVLLHGAMEMKSSIRSEEMFCVMAGR